MTTLAGEQGEEAAPGATCARRAPRRDLAPLPGLLPPSPPYPAPRRAAGQAQRRPEPPAWRAGRRGRRPELARAGGGATR